MAVIDEQDDRFYVGPSQVPGAGRGLFAKVPLEAGAKLEVLGVLIERETVADECTHFADQHKIRFGDRYLIIPLGFAGMANHSLTPNLEKFSDGENLYLRTLKPVVEGEELFFTYTDYARERFGLG